MRPCWICHHVGRTVVIGYYKALSRQEGRIVGHSARSAVVYVAGREVKIPWKRLTVVRDAHCPAGKDHHGAAAL